MQNQLTQMLKEQLQHEEHETEVYASKVRETEHSVVKLIYAKLMRDSTHHVDVLNSVLAYLARSRWEAINYNVKESRDEILRLMDLEDKALRLFTFSFSTCQRSTSQIAHYDAGNGRGATLRHASVRIGEFRGAQGSNHGLIGTIADVKPT